MHCVFVNKTYLNREVRVQQHLELEALLPLVAHIQHRLQAILAQRHAVHQSELVWPCLLCFLAKLSCRKSEVELYTVVASLLHGDLNGDQISKNDGAQVANDMMVFG